MKGPIFVKYLFFLNPISLNRFMFNFIKAQFSTFSGASEALFWVTVFPATLKTFFTFAACHENRKDDPDGADDDDDDCDENDDDGD